MQEKIIIVDFGSQYTQLIARNIRSMQIYCSIYPFQKTFPLDKSIKGIILSGGPNTAYSSEAPTIDLTPYIGQVPILGICYGAQLIAYQQGAEIIQSTIREYGGTLLTNLIQDTLLFHKIPITHTVWMSHNDTITSLPAHIEKIATTASAAVAAYQIPQQSIFGVQFHPEVTHSTYGKQLLKNFVLSICGCQANWTPDSLVQNIITSLQKKIGNDHVIMALSGGVDSTVAATLLSRAIGNQLHCIFINNGLLRKYEYDSVLKSYQNMGLSITGIDASQYFYQALQGLTDPEQKRKAIGKTFIEVFEKQADGLPQVKWLGQGTIYPDIIESFSKNSPSVTIKSHHNVGGLPKHMKLKVVEPLNQLFKDEVRVVGEALNISSKILERHPFPGPGLGIRIIGEITADKVAILQDADDIFITALKTHQLYDKVWQAGVILLPIQAVGVMGDSRTYEQVVGLRAVTSIDGMTADWAPLPYDFLGLVANQIINQVPGINRVVYDISSKPPATIEWE